MHNFKRFGALTLAASVLAGPAFAQAAAHNPAAGAATTAPATHTGTSSTTATTPSSRNPVLTDAGDARASKLIGSSVYNDRDDKIGTVDDVLINRNGGPPTVVLSVGGFLGMGTHYVGVPYSSLKFGDTNAGSANRVVMAGATKDSLKAMTEYSYTAHRG